MQRVILRLYLPLDMDVVAGVMQTVGARWPDARVGSNGDDGNENVIWITADIDAPRPVVSDPDPDDMAPGEAMEMFGK
jgi:hypothetical protein